LIGVPDSWRLGLHRIEPKGGVQNGGWPGLECPRPYQFFKKGKVMEQFWKEKIKKVVKISKKYGFDEQNEEFWKRQPAGVISLVVAIESNSEGYRSMV